MAAPTTPFIKELKTETRVRAFLFKKDGICYRLSLSQRPRRSMEIFVHECTRTGKVFNWGKELFTTLTLDPETAFGEFCEKILTEQKN